MVQRKRNGEDRKRGGGRVSEEDCSETKTTNTPPSLTPFFFFQTCQIGQQKQTDKEWGGENECLEMK